MAINRQTLPAGAKAFVDKAEDGKRPRWQRGNRTQIILSIAPRLLERLDEAARKRETTRAALVALWLREKLDQQVPA